MTEKPKNESRRLRYRLFGLVQATLTGVVLLALLGLIGAVAVSVSRRYRMPDEALANFPQLTRYETRWWFEDEINSSTVSGFEVTQRQVLADMDAVLLVVTWRRDLTIECVGSLLMREIQDFIGGWEELRYSGGGCSSGSSGSGGGSAAFDFWESPVWEFPRYYYFAYIGTTPDDGAIEFVLSDGTSASASPVEDSIGLIVRRSEPFYIDKIRYLDANGELIFERPGI